MDGMSGGWIKSGSTGSVVRYGPCYTFSTAREALHYLARKDEISSCCTYCGLIHCGCGARHD